MKVLAAIVAPPHLAVSGAARAAERLSAALTRDCDMTVASMMPETTWGVAVAHAPVRTWLPARAVLPGLPNRYRTPFYRSDIADLIRPGSFDLVHIHNPMPGLQMERIARACRRARIPYVVSTHGFHEICNGNAVYGFGPARRVLWDRLVYRPVARATWGAAGVLLLSDKDRRVVRAMGYGGNDFFVVPNGVERRAAPSAETIAAVTEKFGVERRGRGRIVCMFLANHSPNKGLGVLFEAFASLDGPFVLVVGGDQRPDVDYAGFAGQLREGQRVVFTGRLLDEEVAALMARADLFVFPSLADTLPLTVQEALGAGLPVLASAVGGIPRQIDRSCGMLLPPGNAGALAEAVAKLSRDPRALAAMAEGARRRFATLPDWDECAHLAVEAYRKVLVRNRSLASRRAPGAGSEPTVEQAA